MRNLCHGMLTTTFCPRISIHGAAAATDILAITTELIGIAMCLLIRQVVECCIKWRYRHTCKSNKQSIPVVTFAVDQRGHRHPGNAQTHRMSPWINSDGTTCNICIRLSMESDQDSHSHHFGMYWLRIRLTTKLTAAIKAPVTIRNTTMSSPFILFS